MITEWKARHVEPDIAVVEIAGRLNLGNTLQSIESSLKQQIEAGARQLVVDLSALDFIDSSGIGMLVALNGMMEHAGGKVRVAGAKGIVAKSFALVHMERIVPLDADAAASCSKFAEG